MNKLTPEYIESVIDDVRYDLPGSKSTLTVCIITVKNGTEIVGKSACCSIDLYDAFIGKQIARADAVRQIWPLEGYLLKERMLYQNGKREPETKAAEPEVPGAIDDNELLKADKIIEETEEKTAIKAVTEDKEKTPEATKAEPAEETPGKITEITPTADVIEPEPKIA